MRDAVGKELINWFIVRKTKFLFGVFGLLFAIILVVENLRKKQVYNNYFDYKGIQK